jgi:hypothetical protein
MLVGDLGLLGRWPLFWLVQDIVMLVGLRFGALARVLALALFGHCYRLPELPIDETQRG